MRISDWSSDVCSSDLIMCVPQVIGAGNHGEDAAVADDTADRNAAEADAVIAALAPDQACPRAPTDRTLIGPTALHRGIHRFRIRPGVENPIDPTRRDLDQPIAEAHRPLVPPPDPRG